MKKLISRPTSGEDIINIIGYPVNVITYKDLAQYNRLEELFTIGNATVILYETSKNYGHWCCIFKSFPSRGKDSYTEFFDSYGIFPDDQSAFSDVPFRYLNLLMMEYISKGHTIEYNNYKFQSEVPKVATCGRHVAVRLRYKDLRIDEYKEFLDTLRLSLGVNYDELITLISI